MAFLSCALDASYCNRHPHVVAGLVGSTEQWQELEANWRDLLDYYPALEGNFHLSRLPRMIGHEQGQLCAAAFAKLIGKSGLTVVSGTVAAEEFYRAQAQGRFGDIFKRPHYFSLYLVLQALSDEVSVVQPNLPCEILLDEDYQSSRDAALIYELWIRVRQVQREEFPLRMLGAGIRKQCADLIAGATRFDPINNTLLYQQDPDWKGPGRSLISLASGRGGCRGAFWSEDATRRASEALARASLCPKPSRELEQ